MKCVYHLSPSEPSPCTRAGCACPARLYQAQRNLWTRAAAEHKPRPNGRRQHRPEPGVHAAASFSCMACHAAAACISCSKILTGPGQVGTSLSARSRSRGCECKLSLAPCCGSLLVCHCFRHAVLLELRAYHDTLAFDTVIRGHCSAASTAG